MKKILIGLLIGIGITTVGCVQASDSGAGNTYKFEYKSTNAPNVRILIDKETGLEYIETTTGITPRYDNFETKYTNSIKGN